MIFTLAELDRPQRKDMIAWLYQIAVCRLRLILTARDTASDNVWCVQHDR